MQNGKGDCGCGGSAVGRVLPPVSGLRRGEVLFPEHVRTMSQTAVLRNARHHGVTTMADISVPGIGTALGGPKRVLPQTGELFLQGAKKKPLSLVGDIEQLKDLSIPEPEKSESVVLACGSMTKYRSTVVVTCKQPLLRVLVGAEGHAQASGLAAETASKVTAPNTTDTATDEARKAFQEFVEAGLYPKKGKLGASLCAHAQTVSCQAPCRKVCVPIAWGVTGFEGTGKVVQDKHDEPVGRGYVTVYEVWIEWKLETQAVYWLWCVQDIHIELPDLFPW